MKELVLAVLVCAAVAEPPAPYAPSGWRPSGPAFDLPQRGPQPLPLDPRNPQPPATSYGIPDDVSVQGLPPQQEAQPLFQPSPISGQQYAGPAFNQDLSKLDQSFKQSQYEQQQERYREYQRQKQLEAQNAPNGNRLPSSQNPRQFASRPSSTTTEASTTPMTSTTELDLNQGEIINEDSKSAKLQNGKTSVEVTKQNVKEYPGEFFLRSLAQIQLQPQFVPLQPISGAYLQPQVSQKQVAGFDAATHFAALPSVLAQQNQPNPALLVQNEPQTVVVQQPYQPNYQPQVQPQTEGVFLQAPVQLPNQANFYAQPNPALVPQPNQFQPNAFQPAFQPNPDAVSIQNQFGQIQAQRVIYQPQPQFTPSDYPQPAQPQNIGKVADEERDREEQEDSNQNNPQQLYQQPIVVQPQLPAQLVQQNPSQFYQPQPQNQYLQPQTQFLQPQGQYNQPQGQFAQPDAQFVPEGQYQPQIQYQPQTQYQPQPQFLQPQFLQPQEQYLQPQGQLVQGQFPQGQFAQQSQGQDALQSGLDINQDGNDIDQTEDRENEPEGATAVATAFGSRTQPRVQPKYGVPLPVPRVQATTESNVEEVTEEGAAVATATAVANGDRRGKSARLRSRRLRPVYAVDRSGRLVFGEAQ